VSVCALSRRSHASVHRTSRPRYEGVGRNIHPPPKPVTAAANRQPVMHDEPTSFLTATPLRTPPWLPLRYPSAPPGGTLIRWLHEGMRSALLLKPRWQRLHAHPLAILGLLCFRRPAVAAGATPVDRRAGEFQLVPAADGMAGPGGHGMGLLCAAASDGSGRRHASRPAPRTSSACWRRKGLGCRPSSASPGPPSLTAWATTSPRCRRRHTGRCGPAPGSGWAWRRR
jgi:hypothetical protein